MVSIKKQNLSKQNLSNYLASLATIKVKGQDEDFKQVVYWSFMAVIWLFFASESAYGAPYDLNNVKAEMIDKGWAFIDQITPIIAVSGGLLGAFMARNMDWGMRAIGFGTGTVGFGLATQGVKAYFGI